MCLSPTFLQQRTYYRFPCGRLDLARNPDTRQESHAYRDERERCLVFPYRTRASLYAYIHRKYEGDSADGHSINVSPSDNLAEPMNAYPAVPPSHGCPDVSLPCQSASAGIASSLFRLQCNAASQAGRFSVQSWPFLIVNAM